MLCVSEQGKKMESGECFFLVLASACFANSVDLGHVTRLQALKEVHWASEFPSLSDSTRFP